MTLSTPPVAPMLVAPPAWVNEMLRYGVFGGCAAGVGVHVGIIPAHVREDRTVEVAAFAASSAILAILGLLVGLVSVAVEATGPAGATALFLRTRKDQQ